jgi:hypothetical protein
MIITTQGSGRSGIRVPTAGIFVAALTTTALPAFGSHSTREATTCCLPL